MKDLIHTTDAGILNIVEAHLRQAGLSPVILDMNASLLEGSIGILPRRLMVVDDEYAAARHVVLEMGLGHELKEPPEK